MNTILQFYAYYIFFYQINQIIKKFVQKKSHQNNIKNLNIIYRYLDGFVTIVNAKSIHLFYLNELWF